MPTKTTSYTVSRAQNAVRSLVLPLAGVQNLNWTNQTACNFIGCHSWCPSNHVHFKSTQLVNCFQKTVVYTASNWWWGQAEVQQLRLHSTFFFIVWTIRWCNRFTAIETMKWITAERRVLKSPPITCSHSFIHTNIHTTHAMATRWWIVWGRS